MKENEFKTIKKNVRSAKDEFKNIKQSIQCGKRMSLRTSSKVSRVEIG